ncbi:hypothetical protein [Sphingomonas jatrophae]|uniref:Uncharacterized protein n=1 Tax=Sphingomonas jatrophae TaxID=1166337 RepID=A0A1I6LHM4_9SPHN|nr:hypothetical protein [Sphingomonas jatrophae]SFS02830.1 hypothetical protein SAMN05192580_2737 [Sphingomonas jatrophae]
MMRALDRLPLGPIMAGAFAAALAFALYAMPNWRLESAVVASGLPDLLGAAEPPLGRTARTLVMLAAALAGGGAVWALFWWIERPRPAPAAAPAATVAMPIDEAPTLRRADAHPDAPPRRPIFAAQDLGAPLDEAPVIPWREDRRQLAPVTIDASELLLDKPFVEPAADPLPDSAAGLLARLEAGLVKRGTAPRPDARLREALTRGAA